MFDFKKKILNPLISRTIGKIDEALKTEGVPQKAESLLAVKEEAKNSFNEAASRETKKAVSWLGLAALGAIVMFPTGGFIALTSPLLIVGAALYASGILMCMGKISTKAALKNSLDTVDHKISASVLQLLNSNPQEAVTSPRFLKALKDGFNTEATKDHEDAYEQLRSSIKAKAPAQRTVRGTP